MGKQIFIPHRFLLHYPFIKSVSAKEIEWRLSGRAEDEEGDTLLLNSGCLLTSQKANNLKGKC